MANKRTHDEMAGAKPTLQRLTSGLYETGEWSDLSIEAGRGPRFKVHKAVVCPASAYFHTACTSGLGESATNTIKLPESWTTVDAILRHLYEVPAEWTLIPKPPAPARQCAKSFSPSHLGARTGADSKASIPSAARTPPTQARGISTACDLIALRIAADKYDITSMAAGIEATFDHLLRNLDDNTSLVSIGISVFNKDGDFLKWMRDSVLRHTAKKIKDICADKTTFELICSHKVYLQKAILAL